MENINCKICKLTSLSFDSVVVDGINLALSEYLSLTTKSNPIEVCLGDADTELYEDSGKSVCLGIKPYISGTSTNKTTGDVSYYTIINISECDSELILRRACGGLADLIVWQRGLAEIICEDDQESVDLKSYLELLSNGYHEYLAIKIMESVNDIIKDNYVNRCIQLYRIWSQVNNTHSIYDALKNLIGLVSVFIGDGATINTDLESKPTILTLEMAQLQIALKEVFERLNKGEMLDMSSDYWFNYEFRMRSIESVIASGRDIDVLS